MDTLRVCSIDGTAIVVDIGISYKKLKNRAMTRDIDLSKIKAVFVSHEHSDHVYGLHTMCHKLNIPAYMTHGTYKGMRSKYRPEDGSVRFFSPGDTVALGPFSVHSFAKPHDVVEPCSFRVEAKGINVGVFTDIGAPCEALKENLQNCHMAFLESNYDEDMLRNGSYTEHLKKRITCGTGHLSNRQSADLVRELGDCSLHTIFLSHISQENNTPDTALKAFEEFGDKYTIKVMSRFECSRIWRISASGSEPEPPVVQYPDRLDRPALQLELFAQP